MWVGLVVPMIAARAAAAEPAEPNIEGSALEVCSTEPMTGWFRDGHCRTDEADRGTHVICAEVTRAFLELSRSRGNDLVSPSPEHRFPGLKPGDRWCLCALRWREAERAGKAPPVIPAATHHKALEILSKERLLRWAHPEP